MTWSTAESLIIKELSKQSATTAENVREIKEAIVGSLRNGGKPGLQDTVREMKTDIGINRDRFIDHKRVDGKYHKLMKRGIIGVGTLTLIGLALNIDKAGPLLGSLVRLLIKIFT